MPESVDAGMKPGQRANCPRCLRPLRACLCQWIRPTEHEAEVLLIQHPAEVRHAKGSARLLHLSLPHSQLIVGEQWDQTELQAHLNAPLHGGLPAFNLLLYPETSPPQADTPPIPADPSRIRLIVLDGTWRQSRKLLMCNPVLQGLPRLALQAQAPTRYAIRKAHRPDQLSTLEATCQALAQLEGHPLRYQALLEAFDGFVQAQQAWVPTSPSHTEA